ncbi:hypothetical protein [Myxococcus qinghaiensis]|uniref:hypothetical protein n=1 Tax=Myxococcus qinghaiensis TaxID=2906758 RepID=UPI0020A76C61|nr:hypothetical protein [Myxococcus qinghaiensis]MCP3169234.1 hypothetical protein [Myxococcus qinghaiensis]
MFNLWSPYLDSSGTLWFDITCANMPRLNKGSREWMDACLRSLDIPTGVARSWTVHPLRALFYSDYRGHDDWLDRWPATWTVQVELSAHQGLQVVPSEVPVLVDERDSTWDGDYDEATHGSTALIIAAFPRGVLSLEPLKRAVLRGPLEGAVRDVSLRPVSSRNHQVRVLVGVEDFARSAPALEAMVEAFEQRGGKVNWQDLSP